MYLRTALACLVLSGTLTNAVPFGKRNNDHHHDYDYDHAKADCYGGGSDAGYTSTSSAVESTSTWSASYPSAPSPSVILLPDVVLNTTGPAPPVVENTTLPSPEANSTIINTSGGGDAVIVIPVNTTSLSPDNGDVSKEVTAPDNSTVVVGTIPNTPVSTDDRVLFRPGTYANSPTVQAENAAPVAFSFTGPTNYYAAISNPEDNPSFPETDGCSYTYQSVLGGGNGSVPAAGGLWALEGYVWLTPANIRQGTIGDCGMGSAIMSLASQGIGRQSWTYYLAKLIDSVTIVTSADGKPVKQLSFHFKYPGKEAIVLIDDTLPTLTSGACGTYLGFQPTPDAVCQNPSTGVYDPTNVFFVPLLEKAFAKYIDAFPELRSKQTADKGYTGYLGLEGIRPDIVLASFTGGQPGSVFRNLQSTAPIIAALIRCIREDVICAVDTYPTSLEGMGPKDEFGVVHLLGDSGWAASNSQWNQDVSYTVIDFDDLNSEGRSHLQEMIGLHAYGIDYLSTPFPGIVKLLNPWGCNPTYSDQSGYCSTYNGPQLEMSLRVFVSMLRAVYFVENPIALDAL
ncbi:hypothetical protein QFC24_000706 [Naganishia onofrii]|uniref:Uncharacterized protein n=1 Tax=Naganishia onofrii TaxID=1851511 RepID=A0ACC2XTC4_9TREE|nr:hypothetical protein QFC24_000706 [Naganishia onofrii]